MSKELVAHSSEQFPTESSVRLADLAKVHIAKRDLKLTDELYRGFLQILFGEASAKDLTHEQIEELLDHFKSLGWMSGYPPTQKVDAKKSKNKKPPNSPASEAQIRLIEYLWTHGSGIRKKTHEALEHFLSHYFHIAHFREVKTKQVPGILGAIRKMAQR